MEWRIGLIELDKGVHAYIQPRGTWFIANAGLIVGRDFSIVIDSLTNEKMALDFLSSIRRVTDKPIRFLINTHYHGDHTWTNHLFNAITIAHVNTRRLIEEEMRMSAMRLYEKLFPEIDFSGARYTLQDLVFSESLTLYVGDKSVEVKYIGYPAHTIGDAYIYIPDSRVVFAGDLLFAEPCTPFVLFGSVSGSIEALDNLASLNADIYVPGHGPISYGRKALYRARDYLTYIRDEAWRLFKEGLPFNEAARRIDLREFANWYDKERVVGNVARAYSEFRGERPGAPLQNLNEIILEMNRYRQYTQDD